MTVPSKIYLGGTLISAPRFLTPEDIGTARTSTTNPAVLTASVAPSATAHTKGAWVEIIASTPATADLLTLIYNMTSASGVSGLALADIGVGSSGSETVLVSNIAVGSSATTASTFNSLDIPVHVAAGTRLSVRFQSGRASATNANFGIMLQTIPGVTSPSTVTTIGANTATSGGVTLGGTNNTFVQITGSTAAAYRGVVMCPMSDDTSMIASDVAFDLGVGGSGSEVVHRGNRYYRINNQEFMTAHPMGSAYLAVDIPAGSRLAVKFLDAQATSNAGYHMILIGIPA